MKVKPSKPPFDEASIEMAELRDAIDVWFALVGMSEAQTAPYRKWFTGDEVWEMVEHSAPCAMDGTRVERCLSLLESLSWVSSNDKSEWRANDFGWPLTTRMDP